jgi:hypothetical protein
LTLFIAFLKALPQFLPFLLTLLKGEKANMSGHKDPSKGRMLLLLLVTSLIGTGILYFDARGIELDLASKEKEIDALNVKIASLTKEIDQMKRDGVPSPTQIASMQKQAGELIQLNAQVTHLQGELNQCLARPHLPIAAVEVYWINLTR